MPVPTPPGDRRPSFPLSPAQVGFLLTEAIDPAAATTWCARLAVDGPLDLDLLRQALEALVQRHLMLRVRMLANERPPRQREEAFERPLQLRFDDLMPAIAAGAAAMHLVDEFWRAEQAQRFALDRLPLLRMRVLRLSPNRHIWLIAAHHVIGDGWSAWVFGQDLLQIYDCFARGEPLNLPALRSTFRDYVNILQQQDAGGAALHEQYWRNTFARPYRRPTLRRDHVPATSSAATSSVSVVLPPATLGHLRRVAAEEHVSPYILLLTLFVHQLRRFSGADDLVIGTAHSGRDLALPDIERLFGCFATALPIRVSPRARDRQAPARSLLHDVAAAFRTAYLHALPPSAIARLIPPDSGSPAITATGAQFFFTFLDFDPLGPLRSETLAIDWDASHTEVQPPLGATELLLAARSANGALRITLQGAASSIDPATLQTFINDLIAEINALTATPSSAGASASTIRFATGTRASTPPDRLDAALIGYLPPSRSLAAFFGLRGDEAAVRTGMRGLLFPDSRPRWLEDLKTPIGRSGLLCLPWFAEELRTEAAAQLGAEIAAGMLLAGKARGALRLTGRHAPFADRIRLSACSAPWRIATTPGRDPP
jgi:non-ribosomal peptide synthetase component F